MKSQSSHSRHHQHGFTLILVIGFLVLIVGLVFSILSWSMSARATASGFNAEGNARQLADTAVSLVEGQINLATTQGSTVSWASQPGMVRTFDTSGNLLMAYKLYSAPNMVLAPPNSGSNSILNASGQVPDYPPATWNTDNAIWTDLNDPVVVNTGTASTGTTYPIVDKGATSSTAAGYSVDTTAPAVTALGTGVSYQPTPMPVQWLYQLRDGTLVAPTGSGGTATVAGASSSNPIVGRIAFWTDDDTCKININTAGEGTFWDTPRACSVQEEGYGAFQAAQTEYQRFAGHPAMTDLSTVLPFGQTIAYPFGSGTLSLAQLNNFYTVAPRSGTGGSNGGTTITGASTNTMTNHTDRLYANVDELVFNPSRGANPTSGTSTLTLSQVEAAKFFLTARSRAPETNLFNMPRVACWPIYNAMPAANTSAFDQLIAFCSSSTTSTGTAAYYFQRQTYNSPTVDIGITRNTQLYQYLQYLTGTAIPGYGTTTFQSKYGADRDQILTEIFDFIRSANLNDSLLASTKGYTPGTGAGQGFVVPTQFTSPNTSTSTGTATMGFGRTYTLSEFAIGFICNADGNDTTYGSNTATLTPPTGTVTINTVLNGTPLSPGQRYVQAVIVPQFFSPMHGWVSCSPNLAFTIKGLSNLSLNGSPIFPNLDFTGQSSSGSNSFFSTLAYNGSWGMSWWGTNPGWRWFGLSKKAPTRGTMAGDTGALTPATTYPYIGIPVIVTGNTMSFQGGQVTLNIYANPSSTLPYTAATGTAPIQTFILNLPSTTLPVPNLVTSGYALTKMQDWWSFSANTVITETYNAASGTYAATGTASGRMTTMLNNENGSTNPASPGGGTFFFPTASSTTSDVVRSILPAHGDFRLIAATATLNDPGNAVFIKHPNYDTSSTYISSEHNLTSFDGQAEGNYVGCDPGGKYNTAITYASWLPPDIPSSATGSLTPQSSGDFDTGISAAQDGPYVNKPDEGTAETGGTGQGAAYFITNWAFSSTGGATYFSPNRQIAGPGVFGSLPTGVIAGVPWRTLLFRPQPSHFGATAPKDSLLMDDFWMPVVQPYAISDRFSTAGKINMNYEIMPFTYIKRPTGLEAILKSEMVATIPNTAASTYKPATHGTWTTATANYRVPIDIPTTLSQFDSKFTTGDIFHSASDICDLYMVPSTPAQTIAQMATFYQTNYALTGENLREHIYTTIYPRLTTKSNTYTVHFRAQALKKAPTTNAGQWVQGTDVVIGEYRGSTSIERFINPSTQVPDYAKDAAAGTISSDATLDTFYKWHTVENKQFAP